MRSGETIGEGEEAQSSNVGMCGSMGRKER